MEASLGIEDADVMELRRFRRRPIETDITLESESQFYSGFSENLSEGGIFVATHGLLAVGAPVAVVFTIPSVARKIRVEGHVRWVRVHSETSDLPPGMGIEFGKLGADELEAIRAFCAQRSPLFYD
ncbi:MAG TPA: TIGR02266 family protein [Polyangiaceae bacterium]|jgi:uncharacterized protein (TIGR02266 family)